MADQVTTPRAEDLVSVGTRISWGAILAGGILALALQFLFTLLGSAVGLSITNRMSADRLQTAAVIWALFTLCLSLFVGGLVISQFTVGENKVEAMLYGIIMWGLLLAMLLGLGTVGAAAGFSSLVGMANMAQSATTQDWEASARQAGVPVSQIDEWRTKLAERARDAKSTETKSSESSSGTETTKTTQTTTVSNDNATRITWYVFLGTWASMMAAALGALIGAGPTFRVVAVRTAV
jgi:hypothetical protein